MNDTEQFVISTNTEALQINFLAFSSDLQTVYAYVQNNQKLYDSVDKQYTIKKVMVNGVDVTSLTNIGTSQVYDQVVPLTINLPTALYQGAQTVVMIETFQGVSCGHTLRAMPSEFLINVPFFASYRMRTDEEAAQDWPGCSEKGRQAPVQTAFP